MPLLWLLCQQGLINCVGGQYMYYFIWWYAFCVHCTEIYHRLIFCIKIFIKIFLYAIIFASYIAHKIFAQFLEYGKVEMIKTHGMRPSKVGRTTLLCYIN